MTEEPHDFISAYAPKDVAKRVEGIGVAKARADVVTMFVLAVLAGAFISIGALFFTVVVTGSNFGFGVTRLLGGVAFSVGLILVVVAGAELFTGNNLIAMAWASRLIGTREVLRSWLIVYVGNVVGCLGTLLLVLGTDVGELAYGAVGQTAIQIARAKSELTVMQGFTRGILCNALVCLAVWLAIGARSVTDKILAVVFPVTAFVVIGFEHSIANWFLLPFGYALDQSGTVSASGVARNLVAVSVGNIVGGTLLVGGVYWIAYLRGGKIREAPRS